MQYMIVAKPNNPSVFAYGESTSLYTREAFLYSTAVCLILFLP